MMVEKQILSQPTSMRLDDAIPIHVRALLDKASQLSDHFARSSCGDGLAVIVRYKQKWQSMFSDIKEPWPKVVAVSQDDPGTYIHADVLVATYQRRLQTRLRADQRR